MMTKAMNNANSKNNIIITGFMGTGKTSVGLRVAELLNRQFYDTDNMIQEKTGMSISKIFDQLGEKHFRQLENELAKKLHLKINVVISTGGSMLINNDNHKLLQQSGIIFCLSARPEKIMNRLSNSKDRPLLETSPSCEHIIKLLEKRKEAYQRLPNHIDTSDISIKEAAENIVTMYKNLVN